MTTPQPLATLLCPDCQGAGLELAPDGRAHCRFCGAVHTLPGPICPRCELANAAGVRNCAACGLALFRTCPACEHVNWSGAEACTQCGRSLDTLSALMARAGDAGERYTSRQRDLAGAARVDEAAARERRAYLEDIDRRREAAIAASAARKAREQRLFVTVVMAIAGVVVIGLALFTVIGLLTQSAP